MILIEIGGLRDGISFGKDRNKKLREHAKWQIMAQYNQNQPLTGPIWCNFTFHMPIAKGTSKIRRTQMLNGMLHHLLEPKINDLVNLYTSFLEGIIFERQSQIYSIESSKIYSEKNTTIIKIHA